MNTVSLSMKSIKLNIYGKQIPLKVEDDQVETMQQIAAYVDEKLKTYRNQLSNQPDSMVMILASLSIAEDLFQMRNEIHQIKMQDEDRLKTMNDLLEKTLDELF